VEASKRGARAKSTVEEARNGFGRFGQKLVFRAADGAAARVVVNVTCGE
jgi:hypothetical protein